MPFAKLDHQLSSSEPIESELAVQVEYDMDEQGQLRLPVAPA
jgi:hypothetical protein